MIAVLHNNQMEAALPNVYEVGEYMKAKVDQWASQSAHIVELYCYLVFTSPTEEHEYRVVVMGDRSQEITEELYPMLVDYMESKGYEYNDPTDTYWIKYIS